MINRGWIIYGILSFLLGGLPSGCATIDDLSTETYRKFDIPAETFHQETIGLLPMFGRSSVREYLTQADAIFLTSLHRHREDRLWVDSQESLKRIREAGLETFYRDWARAYTVEHPPRQEPLQQIGKAVGTRYLLLAELQRIEVAEGATQVRLTGRIWDTEKGEILWEGIGESRGYVFLIFPWAPSSFEKTMAVASDGLVHRLP